MSDGFEALLSGIDQGSPQALALLKSHQVHIQALDDYTNGELVLRAVRGGNVEIVRWLLKSGLRPASFPLAVFEAIQRGGVKIAQLLLRLPMDVNTPDHNGWSMLHHAAHNGDKKLVNTLIEKGADPKATTPDEMTPLLIAIFEKNAEAGRLLVEAGVDIEAPWRGYTPLMHAANVGAPPELVRALLERGAGFYVTLEDSGWDALLIATAQNHLPIVEQLVAHGADIDVKDKRGYTPLFIAVNSGFKEIALHLVQQRASVNEPAQDGLTPLTAAIRQGQAEMVRVLLSVDANLEVKGPDGLTPLLLATQIGNPMIVEALLEKGADLGTPGPDGRTALALAEANPELLRLFAQYSPELSQEHLASNATGPLPDLSAPAPAMDSFEAPPTFIGELSIPQTRRNRLLKFLIVLLIIGGFVVGGIWAYVTYFQPLAESPTEEPVVELAPAVASIGAPVEPEQIQGLMVEGAGGDEAHPIERLVDGSLTSSWRLEIAEGAELTPFKVKWPNAQRVRHLRIATGSVPEPTAAQVFLRIEELEIQIEGGLPFKATLDPRGDWQTIPVDKPRLASWASIKPLTFYPAPEAAPEPEKKGKKGRRRKRSKATPKPPVELLTLAEVEVWAEPSP